MQRIADLIRSHLNLRVFLPMLAGALVTTWWGLSGSVAHFADLTGGLRFMDMQPTLTTAALFEQIRSYSPEAIDFYLWWSAFDYAWPFVTFTTMLFIAAWLFEFLPERHGRWFTWLVAAACLTVLMDWGENVGFALLVTSLPEEPSWLARITLGLHAAKLTFLAAFNAGFLLLLAAVIVHSLRSGRAS